MRFYGKIGFAVTEETRPGIWEPKIVPKMYYGDVMRFNSRYAESGKVNEDVTISNVISIIADPFANQNLQNIRYINFMGANWSVSNVEVQYPRLILTIGGIYNGEDESGASDIT